MPQSSSLLRLRSEPIGKILLPYLRRIHECRRDIVSVSRMGRDIYKRPPKWLKTFAAKEQGTGK